MSDPGRSGLPFCRSMRGQPNAGVQPGRGVRPDQGLVERSVGGRTVRVYPGQPETIPEALDRAAAAHGPRPAVGEVGGEPLTHEEFRERTRGVAAQLQQRFGVAPGDRVALLAANGLDFLLGFVGILRAGAVAVPLNTKYRTPELRTQLEKSGARVLLAEPEFWPNAEPVAPTHTALTHELGALERRARGAGAHGRGSGGPDVHVRAPPGSRRALSSRI